MTNYIPTNNAGEWKMARKPAINAGDDDSVGNLSFRKINSSKDKEDFSTNYSRGVERYGISSDKRGLSLTPEVGRNPLW